jgi:hypothetical protein
MIFLLPPVPPLGKPKLKLLGFFVNGVLLAERTILIQRQSVRIILLILKRIIVSVLAFRTFECNFHSRCFRCHIKTPYKKITPLLGV